MVLEGLRLPTFFGWISGVLFVSKPWGRLSFTSYCHPFTLYAFLINIIFIALWVDFYQDVMSFLVDKPLTVKIFYLSTSGGMHAFNGYMRLIFFCCARKISSLFKLISEMMCPVKPRDLRCTWSLFRKLFWGIFIFHFMNALILAIYIHASSKEKMNNSTSLFFSTQPRPLWYYVIFFLFGTFPSACCMYFTFSFIFVSTFCVLCIFEQYCSRLLEIGNKIHSHAGMDFNFSTILSNSTKESFVLSIPSGETDVQLPDEDNDGSSGIKNFGQCAADFKLEALESFDKVKQLFGLYDDIVGPMVLGLLVRNVIIVINEASSVFINPNASMPEQRGCSSINFVGDVVQFVILELGTWTQRRMNKWKTDLEKMIILMPTSFEKDHLSDVVHQVCKWKWQMSASGFFSINRQLMSGIVATMLSYIVILFQLHVSEASEAQPA